eukprot:COSAG02_NODE_1878_length_10554_cov_95.091918_12_plen_456_part_00
MPPFGGEGGSRREYVGVRRAKFLHKVEYWKDICSYCHVKNKSKAEWLNRGTSCLTLIVSILALLATAFGASEPTSLCDDVPSECYVSRAATVLRDSCGGPADCDAVAFGGGEEENAEAPIARDGWLSLLAGVLGLVASALPSCLGHYRQESEAYGSAAHRLGLIAFKVEAKDREAGSSRIADDIWEQLEKELTAVMQDLPVEAHRVGDQGCLTPEQEKKLTCFFPACFCRNERITELSKPEGPLPASLVPYPELVEILQITQEKDKRWLDGDIEVLLERHEIPIEPTLLRNFREQSREAFPDYVPMKMNEEDVLKRIGDKLDNLGAPNSGADVLKRAEMYLNLRRPEAEQESEPRQRDSNYSSRMSPEPSLTPRSPEDIADGDESREEPIKSRKLRIGQVCAAFELETGWEPKCQACWKQRSSGAGAAGTRTGKIWKPRWKCTEHGADLEGGQGA